MHAVQCSDDASARYADGPQRACRNGVRHHSGPSPPKPAPPPSLDTRAHTCACTRSHVCHSVSVTASQAQLISVRRGETRLAMNATCPWHGERRLASTKPGGGWGCNQGGARWVVQDNGLKLSNRWKGMVYVNPPFTTYGQWQFVNRAIDEVENGKVGSAPPLLPPRPCPRSCARCEGGGAGPRWRPSCCSSGTPPTPVSRAAGQIGPVSSAAGQVGPMAGSVGAAGRVWKRGGWGPCCCSVLPPASAVCAGYAAAVGVPLQGLRRLPSRLRRGGVPAVRHRPQVPPPRPNLCSQCPAPVIPTV